MLTICPKCGKEISDDFKFCPECGTKIPAVEEDDVTYLEDQDENDLNDEDEYSYESIAETNTLKETSKIEESKDFLLCHLYFLKRHKAILISTVIVIILACIAGGIFKFISDSNYEKGMEAIDKGNYDQAITYLEKSHGKKAEQSLDLAASLKVSEKNYILGMDLYSQKEYEKALSKLETVISEFPEYNKVKEAIAECDKILVNECLGYAQTLCNKSEYDDAYFMVQKALEYDSNSNEALMLNDEIVKKKNEAETKKQEEEAKAEKARKKSEGVRIGMSQQDVLDSSWGKPNDINRTTNAYGVSEQWCYDNYNYLYFEDGILTDIQN